MIYRRRALSRVTLFDQLTAWAMWRGGHSIDEIAQTLQRRRTGIRRILFGDSSI